MGKNTSNIQKRAPHAQDPIVVTFVGRLDASHAPVIQAQLDQLVSGGVRHIILDLSHIEFLDSAGLAVCVRTLKRVQQDDGSVKLALPKSASARRILQLTRFDRIFEIVELNG